MTQEETAPAIDTLAVHAGERRPGPEGSIVFPIYQGTVYATGADGAYDDLKYIRLSTTPTQRYLCDKLAALEGAESALVTASGMAALAGTLTALLEPGDHLLAGECLYGGTHQFLLEDAPRLGLGCTFIDAQRPEVWESALRPKTRLVLVESIGNPLMRVPRLKEMVAFARAHRLTVLMDNTLASPFNLQPLRHGVDLVFHSATKYLNGHSDIVAGCVMGPAAMVERIRRRQNHFGGALDPHAAFLLARGVKTLALRVRAQNANGLALARALAAHPGVLQVNYTGLEGHPDHAHARELLRGFGGMLSFRPKGGTKAALRLLGALRLPAVAPSLGGVESLVTRPAATSHASLSAEDRARFGITDDLIRVSCGIEDADDLVRDYRQALEQS